MESKPLLSSKDLILKMKAKGVSFQLVDEIKAKDYLENNNYYFKLSSYRKNYDKKPENEGGQYIHLDFAYLEDLAIIDMELRYTLLQLSLDIEHYIKIKILNKAEENKEDGYTIIRDYYDSLSEAQYDYLLDEIAKSKSSLYSNELFSHYENTDTPLWVFLELVPFGRLVSFYYFCSVRFNDRSMLNEHFALKTCKEIRNACAHSNCILNDLHLNTATHGTRNDVNIALSRIPSISRNKRRAKMSNARLQQIVTLLYMHNRIVTSSGVHSKSSQKLNDFITRMNKHLNYYDQNEMIKSSFDFLNKVIDAWFC